MDGTKLESVGLFDGLSAAALDRLASVLNIESHPVGTVLVKEGDLPTKFYVILEGRVTVHRGGSHVVDLGPNDIVGEIGVLSLERRNATVIATTPLRTATAMGWDLRDALGELPEARIKLEAQAAARQAAP